MRALGLIRTIRGAPLFWKDAQTPSRSFYRPFLAASLAVFCLVYVLPLLNGSTFTLIVMGYYVLFLWAVASIRTAAMAAASIATEHEARTWPILLTTALEDRQILRDKLVAVLKRNLGLWLILLVNAVGQPILVLTVFRGSVRFPPLGDIYSHILFCLASIAANVMFLLGVGFAYSLRSRTRNSAVAATLAVITVVYLLRYVTIRYSALAMNLTTLPHVLYRCGVTFVEAACGAILLWRVRHRVRRRVF
jgi:hypothetical protein